MHLTNKAVRYKNKKKVKGDKSYTVDVQINVASLRRALEEKEIIRKSVQLNQVRPTRLV